VVRGQAIQFLGKLLDAAGSCGIECITIPTFVSKVLRHAVFMLFGYLGHVCSSVGGAVPGAILCGGQHDEVPSQRRGRSKNNGEVLMTVVLYVLIYGSESWVLTGDLMRQLRSFHRRCCRGLTGEFIRHDEGGEWICPKSEEVLKRLPSIILTPMLYLVVV
jgi:hypothetical protein